MFTVRDAENAMMTFIIFAIAVIVGIFLHELVLKRNSITISLYTIANNVSNILSAATLLTIFEEGISLMFYRIREAIRLDRKFKDTTRREVYQEVDDWNTRRLQAEARGETFTEPPPGHDSLKPKKKKRFIFF
jgi:hypothetical protein